jgi:hypothetical protein
MLICVIGHTLLATYSVTGTRLNGLNKIMAGSEIDGLVFKKYFSVSFYYFNLHINVVYNFTIRQVL